MSSTTGIQNLLVNVFRPVYVYDPLTTLFTTKLELSNIDAYSGNTISVFTAAVGDSASNVYVGSNAGNSYLTLRGCGNNTAVGFSAGQAISNVSNSVYLGFNAGAGALNASSVIGIGASSGGAGTSNIFIGTGTKSTGSSNILLGHGIDIGSQSNTLRVGSILYGDLSTNWIGIGRSSPFDSNDRLDVSGNVYIGGQVGIQMTPIRTFDVNGDFRASDGSGNVVDFHNGVASSANGFVSAQGTVTNAVVGVTTIGILKKGLVTVSVVDRASSANRAAYVYFAYTTSNVTSLSSEAAGDTSVTTSSSNIQLSNASTTKTYDYSIAYFPLP